MHGLGDLQSLYDANEKCIVDDKSTSSQTEEKFFNFHLRSSFVLLALVMISKRVNF